MCLTRGVTRDYRSGLADGSELQCAALTEVSSSSNKAAKIKYRLLKFEFRVNLSFR